MLQTFQDDLSRLSDLQMARKYLLSDLCQMFDADQCLALREKVSGHFEVEYQGVVLVGSAKLGFSIAPNKRYRPFGDDSDIDIAIVSKALFERVWVETYQYKLSGAYWPKAPDYFKNLARGWIRPDMLPSSRHFPFASTWWDFFAELTQSREFGSYKITAGLYHSSFFLQEYQMVCIRQCRGGM